MTLYNQICQREPYPVTDFQERIIIVDDVYSGYNNYSVDINVLEWLLTARLGVRAASSMNVAPC